MAAHDTLAEVGPLINSFKGRDDQFSEAFKLIAQNDELAQENMESFVANDPRTLWNMATFLLEPKPLTHTVSRIDGVPLSQEEATAAVLIEALLTNTWTRKSRQHMRRGGTSWFAEFIGNLTATGWYAVSHFIDSNKFFADFWLPSQVYPEYSDDIDEGLVRLARVFELPWPRAMRLIDREGWDKSKVTSVKMGMVKITQLWKLVDGKPWLSVVFDQDEVRTGVVPQFNSIPVIVGGVGGIPANTNNTIKVKTSDPKNLVTQTDAVALRGQSIVATNQQVYQAINRQSSFVQQILHDVANPKTWEKSDGGTPILQNPEDWYKRGAHFRMGPNDDMGVFQQTGIPAEASQLLFSLRNMAQRGGFSDITFGNFIQEVTLGLMSQAAESAQQILSPYHTAAKFVFTTVSQVWLDGLLESPDKFKVIISGAEIEALKVLKAINIDIEVLADYAIKIPGDLANRVNLARTTSSKFDLAPVDAIRLFLPEISDVGAALARLETAKAEEHPVFQQTLLISSMKKAANILADSDPDRSRLLRAAAARMEQQILGEPAQAPTNGSRTQSDLNSTLQAGLDVVTGGNNGRAAGSRRTS